MKKIWILILALACLAGCRKDNNSNNVLRGNIDGTAVDWGSNASANSPEPTPMTGADPVLRITGSGSGYDVKIILILNSGTLNTGTYVFSDNSNYSATITQGATAWYAGPAGFFSPPHLFGSGSVTITTLTKKQVAGSFSFTTDVYNGSTKTVTQGEFNIRRN